MKKYVSLILVIILLCGIFAGCSIADTRKDTRTVIDLLGRTVEVPMEVKGAVCIGSGALRLYSYIGDMTKLCGVEACEYGYLISVRPYQMVYDDIFKDLPSVGAGGPQGAPDAEALLTSGADVIFSLYTSDVSAMDELQQKTGIPVVVLSYGDTEAFDTDLITSINLMGTILGCDERAKEVADYITDMKNDLDNRTKDIPDSEKKTVYLGCQSNYGIHGIGSTKADYSLFNAVHAKNILDVNGYTGYYSALDLEAILTMDPDVIILDAGGLSILKEEYQENQAIFDSFSAFKNGEVYLQMPYNAYFTNLEIAYANAYFIGKTLYPEQFADIEPAEKFDEICMTLLGEECYEEIADVMYGGYQKLDVGNMLG